MRVAKQWGIALGTLLAAPIALAIQMPVNFDLSWNSLNEFIRKIVNFVAWLVFTLIGQDGTINAPLALTFFCFLFMLVEIYKAGLRRIRTFQAGDALSGSGKVVAWCFGILSTVAIFWGNWGLSMTQLLERLLGPFFVVAIIAIFGILFLFLRGSLEEMTEGGAWRRFWAVAFILGFIIFLAGSFLGSPASVPAGPRAPLPAPLVTINGIQQLGIFIMGISALMLILGWVAHGAAGLGLGQGGDRAGRNRGGRDRPGRDRGGGDGPGDRNRPGRDPRPGRIRGKLLVRAPGTLALQGSGQTPIPISISSTGNLELPDGEYVVETSQRGGLLRRHHTVGSVSVAATGGARSKSLTVNAEDLGIHEPGKVRIIVRHPETRRQGDAVITFTSVGTDQNDKELTVVTPPRVPLDRGGNTEFDITVSSTSGMHLPNDNYTVFTEQRRGMSRSHQPLRRIPATPLSHQPTSVLLKVKAEDLGISPSGVMGKVRIVVESEDGRKGSDVTEFYAAKRRSGISLDGPDSVTYGPGNPATITLDIHATDCVITGTTAIINAEHGSSLPSHAITKDASNPLHYQLTVTTDQLGLTTRQRKTTITVSVQTDSAKRTETATKKITLNWDDVGDHGITVTAADQIPMDSTGTTPVHLHVEPDGSTSLLPSGTYTIEAEHFPRWGRRPLLGTFSVDVSGSPTRTMDFTMNAEADLHVTDGRMRITVRTPDTRSGSRIIEFLPAGTSNSNAKIHVSGPPRIAVTPGTATTLTMRIRAERCVITGDQVEISARNGNTLRKSVNAGATPTYCEVDVTTQELGILHIWNHVTITCGVATDGNPNWQTDSTRVDINGADAGTFSIEVPDPMAINAATPGDITIATILEDGLGYDPSHLQAIIRTKPSKMRLGVRLPVPNRWHETRTTLSGTSAERRTLTIPVSSLGIAAGWERAEFQVEVRTTLGPRTANQDVDINWISRHPPRNRRPTVSTTGSGRGVRIHI